MNHNVFEEGAEPGPLAAAPARDTATSDVDAAARAFQDRRRAHWEGVARRKFPGVSRHYHRRLVHVFRLLVPPGSRVLELGCGQGRLLAALEPSRGVGVDFSPEMIRQAQEQHPHLTWIVADAHDFDTRETFDAIILSDLVNDLWDVQRVLRRVVQLAAPHTRILINTYNRLWEPILLASQRLHLSRANLPQNWLTVEDLVGLLDLADAQLIRTWPEILFPLRVPLLDGLANRYLAKIWPFRLFALAHILVARANPKARAAASVSVVVPARNEAGNIARILHDIPEMGTGTEIVFVEGHSKDDTWEVLQRELPRHPHRRTRLLRQTGQGKGDAVRHGFAAANGEVLMILDADLTVPAQDLPRFYEALQTGKGEFINGVRLVYPMEEQAMRFFNLVGNKFFSLAFSWLLGQPIKDTLCGTKVLWRADYERIAEGRRQFGDFDPFGDFDLLFGAAKLNLKIVEIPIRYRERTYGETNIRRWRHGWLLLQMVAFASRRIKFV